MSGFEPVINFNKGRFWTCDTYKAMFKSSYQITAHQLANNHYCILDCNIWWSSVCRNKWILCVVNSSFHSINELLQLLRAAIIVRDSINRSTCYAVDIRGRTQVRSCGFTLDWRPLLYTHSLHSGIRLLSTNAGVDVIMRCCHNLCERIEHIHVKSPSPYQKGFRYCTVCAIYIRHVGLLCPCCKGILRRKALKNKSMKVYMQLL